MEIKEDITQRSVITIATGKPYYINLAVNLARSFLYWHSKSKIQFWLVTDQPKLVPKEVANSIHIKSIDPNQYGKGFSTKLYLDEFAQTKYTLFIDADCLVYGNLEKVFDRFKGQSVTAIGNTIKDGEFFCNVQKTIKRLNLPFMPRFIGGIYYLEKTPLCASIFEKARKLLPDYDHIGLVRLRGKENEEPLIALAMAFHGLEPFPDDGSIKAERMAYTTIKSNLLSGYAELNNQYNFPTWVQIIKSTPVIIHYNGNYTDYYYKREIARLSMYSLFNSKKIANCFIYYSDLVYLTSKKLKNLIRPYYRLIFGYRRLKLQER